MRTVMSLSLVLAAAPLYAQSEAASFEHLAAILKPGQMVVVTDEMGRTTKGTVSALSPASLTVLMRATTRTFTEESVRSIKRTDPLGNGTLAGLGAGIAVTAVAYGRCGNYSSEGTDLCRAVTKVYGLLMWMPLGAVIGRLVDGSIGEDEVYYRPQRRQLPFAVSPVVSQTGFKVLLSTSF